MCFIYLTNNLTMFLNDLFIYNKIVTDMS